MFNPFTFNVNLFYTLKIAHLGLLGCILESSLLWARIALLLKHGLSENSTECSCSVSFIHSGWLELQHTSSLLWSPKSLFSLWLLDGGLLPHLVGSFLCIYPNVQEDTGAGFGHFRCSTSENSYFMYFVQFFLVVYTGELFSTSKVKLL